MEREIKFRVFDDGKMIYEKDIKHLSLEDNDILRLAKFFCNVRMDSIIMQYTGLKDKNGKEIYEGDITKELTVVFYQNGCYMTTYSGDMQGGTWITEHRCKFIEVIGNIYENENLIK